MPAAKGFPWPQAADSHALNSAILLARKENPSFPNNQKTHMDLDDKISPFKHTANCTLLSFQNAESM